MRPVGKVVQIFCNGGAEEEDIRKISGPRGLERPPVVERQLKVYPEEVLRINIPSGRFVS
jgi:hypothetical protein